MSVLKILEVLSSDFVVKAGPGRPPKKLSFHEELAKEHAKLVDYHLKEKNKRQDLADNSEGNNKNTHLNIANWHMEQAHKQANEEKYRLDYHKKSMD